MLTLSFFYKSLQKLAFWEPQLHTVSRLTGALSVTLMKRFNMMLWSVITASHISKVQENASVLSSEKGAIWQVKHWSLFFLGWLRVSQALPLPSSLLSSVISVRFSALSPLLLLLSCHSTFPPHFCTNTESPPTVWLWKNIMSHTSMQTECDNFSYLEWNKNA